MGVDCSICVRFFKWLPVVFIWTIIGWSYYAYVIQLCFFSVESVVERIFYLILYHCVFFMFIWAYWQTIFTPMGLVPRHFKLPHIDATQLERDENEDSQRRLLETFARDLPIACRTLNGCIRYCEKCRHVKPDRAHHCSVCGTCVLKMDHHCPWVNNCVSFTNYKYFVLFLGYALLYCFLISVTSLQYFMQFWTKNVEGSGRFHILFLFFVAVMFGVSLMSLFCYHCYLVSVNRSTLESFRPPIFISGPDKNGFSLGRKANIEEIFGEDKSRWILPVSSGRGDGVNFPQKTLEEVRGSLLDERSNLVVEEENDEPGKVVFVKKNLICDVCSKAFSLKSTSEQHYLTHTKEMPCVCDNCRKALPLKSILQQH